MKNANAKAINIFSAVSPVVHGATISEIAEALREKTVNTLTNHASAQVLVRGDDGRLYTFALNVVPVKLDKEEELDAISQACPYVFVGRKTEFKSEVISRPGDLPFHARKIFLVCVAKNADEALEGKYTVVARRQTRFAAVKYANKLGAAFDPKTYECRPIS